MFTTFIAKINSGELKAADLQWTEINSLEKKNLRLIIIK